MDEALSLEDRGILLTSEFGVGLDPRGLAEVLASDAVRVVDAPRDQILALPGDPQRHFFIVLSGRLGVMRSHPDGTRELLGVLGPGEACGAVTAVASKPRWPAEVHAVVATRILRVTTADVLEPESGQVWDVVSRNLFGIVARRAQHLSFRAALLSRRGLRERLAFYLQHQADDAGAVALTFTRQELADVLVVSRASMTRELGRMADDGLIRMVGRGFQILDAAGIAEAAG